MKTSTGKAHLAPTPEQLIIQHGGQEWIPRAVLVAEPAEALDAALIPFIRPGTPITPDPIAVRLHLFNSRRAALVATAVNGTVS